jgi:ribosomal protein S18 acetylase RimI-like enzyme
MFLIRKATLADHAMILKYAIKVVELHQGYNPMRFSTLDNHNQQLSDLFEQELQDTHTVIWVLEKDQLIKGYVYVKMEAESLMDIASARVWLHDIFVDESLRGEGAGVALLAKAKETAKFFGSETLMLHVAEDNKLAQQVFQNFGFQVVMKEMMLPLV